MKAFLFACTPQETMNEPICTNSFVRKRKLTRHEPPRNENTEGRNQQIRSVSAACAERRRTPGVSPVQLAVTAQSDPPPPCWIPPQVSESASDRWLEHAEAAKCLGVSKSTLYRYVCQNRIEYRKFAGRLEYRESVLEKLKGEQVRPARFPLVGIIPSALSSGK